MSSRDALHSDRTRAESFGAGAEAYDRARPGYPAALIDDLMATSPGSVLDVGCGTGKSAQALVARGVDVLGVEPDARMAQVARSHGITVEVATFEDWDDAGRRFDLIVSGQAWHWVDPVRGPEKALAVLEPDGILATFWSVPTLPAGVRDELDVVYERLAPDIDPYSVVRGCGRIEDAEDHGIPGFGPLDIRRYTWDHHYTREGWLELVATHSDHARLPADQLGRLLAAVGDVIDAREGSVTASYTTYAAFARPT